MGPTRRRFLRSAAELALLGAGVGRLRAEDLLDWPSPAAPAEADFDAPKVVVVQFGGGVRRRETIAAPDDPSTTLSPFFFHRLLPEGALYSRAVNREITGHPEGSLYLFTGRYGSWKNHFGGAADVPDAPLVSEYLRKHLGLPEEKALTIHNEQLDSEFLWCSTDKGYGPAYRGGLLSIYRVRAMLLGRDLDATRALVGAGKLHEDELKKLERSQAEHLGRCLRTPAERYLVDGPALRGFWDRFLKHYEPPGARTREDLAPKGFWESLYSLYDRLLPQGDPGWTVLALRALEELKPRFLSVIYRDVDYVHWGLPYLYQRGIARMDEGLWEIVQALDRDPYYRGKTTLFVVPECGRDTSPYRRLPFQHHTPDDPGAHEVFVYARGPGIAKGRRIDREVHTIDLVPTIGKIMGVPTPRAEGKLLEDLFA